jgi:hypothetical protein
MLLASLGVSLSGGAIPPVSRRREDKPVVTELVEFEDNKTPEEDQLKQ